jgi:ankyrin repeat protein
LAAWQGSLSIVKQIIRAGANVSYTSDNHYTALHLAAECGHKAVIEQLLKEGANSSMVRFMDRLTPLYLAAENGHSGAVTHSLPA